MNYTKNDLVYIAGFFDEEGSVVISGSGRGSTVPSSLNVTISQKKRAILDWIVDTIGLGCVITKRNQTGVHQLRVNGQEAGDFLRLFVPYLKDKKREAEIGIKYQDLLLKQNPTSATGPRLTEQQKEERRFFFSELMACRWGYDPEQYKWGPLGCSS